MAAEDLTDLEALKVEFEHLKRRAADVARQHDRADERHQQFPSEFTARQEAELAWQLEAMRTRMVEIEAHLLPFRRIS